MIPSAVQRSWSLIVALVALAVPPGACRSSRPRAAGPLPATVAADRMAGLDVLVVSAVPPEERGGRVLVFLHGYSGRPDEYVPASRWLAQRHRLRVVLPAGPLEEQGGRAWWRFSGDDWPGVASSETDAQEAPPQLLAVRGAISRLLRESRERYAPQELFLGGFSQGGLLSMDVVLAGDVAVDRVGVFSGGLLVPSLAAFSTPPARKPAVVITHGREDEVLAFAQAELLKGLLEKHGFPLTTWRPFDGGHRRRIPELFKDIEALVR
jgi:phospholipase/carboxylesterase